jgi:phytoene dehydrogenase-like protein
MVHDAIVVGSGPNGLSAAIELARAGRSVLVREAAGHVGGGATSAELTLPGFVHDVCSAVHPLAVGSPYFRSLPLDRHGLEWIHPEAPLAHPLDDGSAVLLERPLEATARGLGSDGDAYATLVGPFVRAWPGLEPTILGPPLRVPPHPVAAARFALAAVQPARRLARRRFAEARAQGLFAGLAAHSIRPLDALATAGFGLVLAVAAHAFGWPIPRGGSQRIADALASYLRSLEGEIATGAPVESLAELRGARLVLCDLTPRQLLRLGGDRLPPRFRRTLARYRYGPGAFKLDWALNGPIPWRADGCARAGTVHVGGRLEEIAEAEAAPWRGRHAERPFLLVAQPSVFDPTRAPTGKHTAWAYCHVPNGSQEDMTERVERQLERFAPGFRDLVLARSVRRAAELEGHNPNLVGGDIAGGANTLSQLVARPALRRVPYATPVPGLYLCSASTPPGGGVHGMCGYHAARAALRGSD